MDASDVIRSDFSGSIGGRLFVTRVVSLRCPLLQHPMFGLVVAARTIGYQYFLSQDDLIPTERDG